jgi:hypothetical protein
MIQTMNTITFESSMQELSTDIILLLYTKNSLRST